MVDFVFLAWLMPRVKSVACCRLGREPHSDMSRKVGYGPNCVVSNLRTPGPADEKAAFVADPEPVAPVVPAAAEPTADLASQLVRVDARMRPQRRAAEV